MNWNTDIILRMMPIWISLLALCIGAVSLGWNIYRDVVLKPRLKMRFSFSQILRPGFSKPLDTLVLSATNFGPGSINCSMIRLKEAPLWRRLLRQTKHAFMIYDYENPLSGKLPVCLEVGQSLDLLIRWQEDCFLRNTITHIGLSDSFGRTHWASYRDVRKARKLYVMHFGKKIKANQASEAITPSGGAQPQR